MRASRVRDLLARHHLVARRDLGQNFLVDPALARRLVERAQVAPGDTVVEIGTGLGILTRALAERAARVVTLEVDAGLVRLLRAEGELPENVELHHADALEVDLASFLPSQGDARVVANLPYAIASPLLRRFLDLRTRLVAWAVTVQREVADRLTARPGTPQYGSLTVLHELTVRIEAALDLPPSCFYPVPRVASRFLALWPLPRAPLAPGELSWVEQVVRAAFRHRRKTLPNSVVLAARACPRPWLPRADVLQGILAGMGIDPRTRAQDLTAHQLLELARRIRDFEPGPTHG